MDSLQFQTAEFAGGGPVCDVCRAAIPTEYYKLYSGQENVSVSQTICAACAAKVEAEQSAPSHAAFLRGVLFGAGMALACCIGYAAVILITGLEIGLVAILVGYLVGRAVRHGSQGRGGRRCQIAAVALTYLSITFSYIPVGMQQYNRQAAGKQKVAASQPVENAQPQVTAGAFVMAVVALTGLAVVSPLLNLQSGIGGVLGIFIIGLGLQRAWALTGRDSRQVTGPFPPEGTVALG